MKKRLLFILLALTACKKEVKEELPEFYTYEALLEERERNPESDSIPLLPSPLVEYYTKHNFVIDSSGSLYYFEYDRAIFHFCGFGINFDSIYPAKFIGLNPEKLINIPSLGVEEFVKNKILTDTTGYSLKYISVGSEKDTFQSRDFSKTLNVLDRSGKKVQLYQFRRVTQEESEVLQHKKRKIPYDHTLIKWDSARTTFWKCPSK